MCFFISQNKTREYLEERYKVKFDKPEEYKQGYFFSAFTKPKLPVILLKDEKKAELKNWGLVPYWIKSRETAEDISKNTLNARIETISQKPSFRQAIKKRRCIIPAEGFFEWRDFNKKKYPYFIYPSNYETFSLAGIYEDWEDKNTGEILSTFSIVTTKAEGIMEKIHNTKKRMPLVLSPDREDLWLKQSEINNISDFILNKNKIEAHTIDKNKVTKSEEFNNPDIINPKEYPNLPKLEQNDLNLF